MRIADRDGGWKCFYCKIELFRTEDSTSRHQAAIDHITPQSRGGKSIIKNMVLCCRSCNASKHSSTIDEWRSRKLQVKLPKLFRLDDGSMTFVENNEVVSRENAIVIIQSLMKFYQLLE